MRYIVAQCTETIHAHDLADTRVRRWTRDETEKLFREVIEKMPPEICWHPGSATYKHAFVNMPERQSMRDGSPEDYLRRFQEEAANLDDRVFFEEDSMKMKVDGKTRIIGWLI